MMGEQKQPGWAFWCVVASAAPLLYASSIGPCCWVSSRFGGAKGATIAYRPITFAAEVTGSNGILDAIQWYSQLGSSDFHLWSFSSDQPGHAEWSPFEWELDGRWIGPIPDFLPPAARSLPVDGEAQGRPDSISGGFAPQNRDGGGDNDVPPRRLHRSLPRLKIER